MNSCEFINKKHDIEIRYYYDYFDNILEYRKVKNTRILDDYRIYISNMNKEDERIFNNFKTNFFDKYIYK